MLQGCCLRRGRRWARFNNDVRPSELDVGLTGSRTADRARLAEAKRQGIDPDKVELVPHWHPHQLRHNAATRLRREHGIEIARIILGHRSPAITEVYAEVDRTQAVAVMAKIGG